MAPEEIDPRRLSAELLRSDALTDAPWSLDWSAVGDPGPVLARALGPTTEFHSSGSATGVGRPWCRTWEQLWAEAGLLADLVRGEEPGAVLTFAPPRHLYGMLAGVLVPARLGLPVVYLPRYGALPDAGSRRRWAVMAIPWTFRMLARRAAWVEAAERLTLLHSTAMLPSSAQALLTGPAGAKISLTEIFGSTESGGVAVRRASSGTPDWTLFEDVEFADGAPGADAEEPLCVRGPRLAFPRGQAPPARCRMDDHVRRTGPRSFRFSGRRERLVNVNGRRWNLDFLEETLREGIACADLACVPVRDDLVGEHFELVIVPGPGGPPAGAELGAALARLPVQPRAVRSAEHIDRSDTGKLRTLH